VVGSLKVGVLALQGAFARHMDALADLGVSGQEVRKPEHLENLDALIIPGGETTTMRQQLEFYDFFPELPLFAKERPLLGTCAGLILMATEVDEEGEGLALLDISVRRNAYGRQTESFQAPVTLADGTQFPAIFIRAPMITRWSEEIDVLATHKDSPIWVRQGDHMAVAFHPELTDSTKVHAQFLGL
jgi:5'-phosphate synthase pdxT subunit